MFHKISGRRNLKNTWWLEKRKKTEKEWQERRNHAGISSNVKETVYVPKSKATVNVEQSGQKGRKWLWEGRG